MMTCSLRGTVRVDSLRARFPESLGLRHNAPGDIRVEEAPIPTPGPGEVVIKNKVTLPCGTDVKTYKRGYRYEPPFGFGHEASGIVHAVGDRVEKFKVGDRVVAHNSAPCGHCYYCKHGQESMCESLIQNQFDHGAYAEYQLIPAPVVEMNMFSLPETMSYKQAALLEPMACSVYGTANCPIEMGDYVVVNGCGPIGLGFVRMRVLRGAHVIAVDVSDARLEAAKKLGAIDTYNPTKDDQDQAMAVKGLTPDCRGVDVAVDATGLPSIWESAMHMARPGGFVLLFGGLAKGSEVKLDAGLMHYSQITVRDVFHTTPMCVNATFELIKMGQFPEEIFVQNEYPIEETEKAILEHASGAVIKNAIVYND